MGLGCFWGKIGLTSQYDRKLEIARFESSLPHLNGGTMFSLVKRLELLKSYLDDELKQSNPSKPYIDDLQSSIEWCEQQLKAESKIIVVDPN